MAKMTTKEFNALERNTSGDVIRLSDVFYQLTDGQVRKLSSDDWSRYYEYQEELDCLYAEARAEFA